MAILSHGSVERQSSNQIMDKFFRELKIGRLLRSSNIHKSSGVSPLILFRYMFGLVFMNQNHYEAMQAVEKPFFKDTVYRFLNEGCYHWEKFLLSLAVAATNLVRSWSNTSQNTLALVVDDTLFKRNRSRKVELLSWVRDHKDGRYYRGFNMLNVAWTDGKTIIPCLFRMAASSNPIADARADIDQRTLAAKRRKSAQKTRPEQLLDMLHKIAGAGIIAYYVLMDSWYFMPKLVSDIKELGYDTIVRIKYKERSLYRYGGRLLPLNALFAIASKREKSSIYHIRVELKAGSGYIPILIVFAPNNRKKGEWVALASTDTTLSREEVIRIYGRRWAIEPMFKMCKDTLRLQSEFQTRSYDATIASATIVMTRYICIALEYRSSTDPRTWGELFRTCLEEITQMGFAEALRLLLAEAIEAISNYFDLDPKEVQEVLSKLCLNS